MFKKKIFSVHSHLKPQQSTGEAASTTSGGSGATTPVLNISEAEKKKLIAEEAARMEALKVGG